MEPIETLHFFTLFPYEILKKYRDYEKYHRKRKKEKEKGINNNEVSVVVTMKNVSDFHVGFRLIFET
jgi:hypothetical protein